MNEIIRYNEVFTLQRGILTYSNFQIQNYSKPTLHLLCLSTFGSFILSPIVTYLIENKSISDSNLMILGAIIDERFSENWRKYADSLSIEYNILDSYNISEIETVEGSNTSNDITNTQENRDIYAFNSIDSVNDSKNDSTMTGNRQNTNLNRREKIIRGNNGNIAPQKGIFAELEFRRKSLIDYILRDLKQFSTLAVVV